jgi:hypothetical protein
MQRVIHHIHGAAASWLGTVQVLMVQGLDEPLVSFTFLI